MEFFISNCDLLFVHSRLGIQLAEDLSLKTRYSSFDTSFSVSQEMSNRGGSTGSSLMRSPDSEDLNESDYFNLVQDLSLKKTEDIKMDQEAKLS